LVVEILAFLLLGLIAMLAIVPPLVRGRIEESPLDSTRNFKRSMLEMAASVNPSEYGRGTTMTRRKVYLPSFLMSSSLEPEAPQMGPFTGRSPGRKASQRRNRTYLILGILTLITGITAIATRNVIALVFFILFAVLLLVYSSLVFMMVKKSR
jgi:hypothetical protein